MSRELLRKFIIAAFTATLAVWTASAQTDGTYVGYSPYSVFGIGNLHNQGTSWNRGMGGVGIAARNKRFVNIMNPASVTARDSLSFMADFGLSGKLSLYSDSGKGGYNAALNIDDFVISFPIWKSSAMYLGVTPLSDVGYRISYSEVDEYSVSRTFTSTGNGGLYQVFAGGAVTFWNRLSLGAQFSYNFGAITKTATNVNGDTSYKDFAAGDSLQINNFGAKLALQYEQPVSAKDAITLGVTYAFSTPMTGYHYHFTENGGKSRSRDINYLSDKGVRMGDQFGVGISYRSSDVWMAEFDYTRSSWLGSGLDKVQGFSNNGESYFATSLAQGFRAGFEITPGRNDVRYYLRRCTYRAGAYYEQSYYTVDGAHVDSFGITLGMTLPVFRWYNGISFALDIGRRGLVKGQIGENYFGFNLGLNMFDIWFKKPRYE